MPVCESSVKHEVSMHISADSDEHASSEPCGMLAGALAKDSCQLHLQSEVVE